MIVKRWFIKTVEGDIVDGPFKTKERAKKEQALYLKRYRYKPFIKSETCKIIKWKRTEGDFEDYGY